MATLSDLRVRVLSVLTSRPAQRIDFWLGPIHVDYNGFLSVFTSIVLRTQGGVGVKVTVDDVPDGAGAAYSSDDDELVFTDEAYGQDDFGRSTIIHECVHAMRDMSGATVTSQSGHASPTTRLTDEAAAYVAGALYRLYDVGSASNSTNPIYVKAYAIAKGIMNTPGAAVSEDDADALRALVEADPIYRAQKVKAWTPSSANGVKKHSSGWTLSTVLIFLLP